MKHRSVPFCLLCKHCTLDFQVTNVDTLGCPPDCLDRPRFHIAGFETPCSSLKVWRKPC